MAANFKKKKKGYAREACSKCFGVMFWISYCYEILENSNKKHDFYQITDFMLLNHSLK